MSSRTVKLIVFGVVGLICGLLAIGIAVEVFAPVQTVNAMGAPAEETAPVTWQGWLMLVVTALSGAGFSAATVKTLLTSSVKQAYDLGRMQTIQYIIRTAKTPEAAAAYTSGARIDSDWIRDDQFKVPEPKV